MRGLSVGAVEARILRALSSKACVGIELTGVAKTGTIYVTLGRLVEKGWVSRDEDKKYHVTWLGLRALQAWGLYYG